MLKFTKLMLVALSLMLSISSAVQANSDKCNNSDKCCTCNSPKNHPEKYVGVYYRSDVSVENLRLASLPIVTLNVDGTAIIYFGEGLKQFVTTGTLSPSYGNWKALKDGKVLVFTIGFSGEENPNTNPPVDEFFANRNTFLMDFSVSLDNPTLIARSSVSLDGVPNSDWLSPSAGEILFNAPIAPRQLKRICAIDSDLTRTQ